MERSREKFGIKLPPGFRLKKEKSFIHLYYQKDHIGVFNGRKANPDEIKWAAENYLKFYSTKKLNKGGKR